MNPKYRALVSYTYTVPNVFSEQGTMKGKERGSKIEATQDAEHIAMLLSLNPDVTVTGKLVQLGPFAMVVG